MEAQEVGQPAQAAPDMEGQEVITNEPGKEAGKVDWQKRYEDSSKEGRKNYEEKVRLEAELKVIKDQLGSLKNQNEQKPNEFPNRDTVVKQLVEGKGFSEEQAGFMYERDHVVFGQLQTLQQQNQALVNMIKFQREQADKTAYAMDPIAQKADAAFKKIPELDALPPAEKRERYLALQQDLGVQVSGRDTTAAKLQAGGAVGGAAGSRTPNMSSADDQLAKSLGMPSAQAFKDFSSVKTDAEMKAWKQKYNIKDNQLGF